MNCQEALNLLYDVLDKEASQIDAAEVQAHLDKCHDCMQKFQMEELLQRLVDERLKSSKATTCTESIRREILCRLDNIDQETSRQASPLRKFRFGGFGSALAMAAVLVLVVGATYVGASLYKHYKQYLPLEQSHWRDSETLAADDPTATDRAINFASAARYDLPESYGEFTRINGHVEELMGVTMAHFVYSHGDKIVSVFVAPASFPIPEDLEKYAVTRNGRRIYDHNCRGCRLVFQRTDHAVVITATVDRSIDLPSFEPGLGTI